MIPHRYGYGALLLILLVLIARSNTVPQASSRSLLGTQPAEIQGLKFVVPDGFQLEQSETRKVSFMRNSSAPLGLFVTESGPRLDHTYLTELSTNLVRLLLREGGGFRWKIQETPEHRVSQYQTRSGTIKGINGTTFVQIDHVVVRAQDKDIVIGSIAKFGDEHAADFLFDVDGREYSVQGWRALFELISSVTGEKEMN